MKEDELVDYLERVIRSCLTFEQLMVTEQWINAQWHGQDFMNYLNLQVRWKEKKLGKNNFGDSFTGIVERIH